MTSEPHNDRVRVLVLDRSSRRPEMPAPSSGGLHPHSDPRVERLAERGIWQLARAASLGEARAMLAAAAAMEAPFAALLFLDDGTAGQEVDEDAIERLLAGTPGLRLVLVRGGSGPWPAAIAARPGVSAVREPVGEDVLAALLRAVCDAWGAKRGRGGWDASLRHAQRAAGIGYWTLRAATGRVDWDAGVRDVLGLAPEQPAGLAVLERLVHPADWPGLHASLSRSLAEGTGHRHEYRVRRPDGEERWIACWGEAQRGAGGAVEGLAGLVQDITERRQAELTYATLLANLPGMAYRCLADASYSLLFVSDGAKALTGHPADALLGERGRGFAHLIHPDDRVAVQAAVDVACAERRPFELTYRIVRADGVMRWVRDRGRQVSPEGVQPPVLEGLITDIHEQRMAEEALSESEERFRLFMDNAPGGAYIKDTENRLLYANAWYVAQSGRRAEEILGQPMDAFLPKEVAESLWRQDQLVLAEGRRMAFEQGLMRPQGLRHYLITKQPWSMQDGRTLIFGMAVDITEQRAQQERLMLMQYALDQVADGAFLVDADGRLRYVNLGACRSLGYDRDELLALSLPEIDPYLPPERWAALWETLGSNRRELFETLHLCRDGRLIPVEVSANYVAHRDGAFVLALARDVSERRAAEEKLRQSDAAFESSADGILVTDARMRILSVNGAFCEISGYSAEEVLGQTPEVLGSGHHPDMTSSAEMWALARRDDRWRGEVWHRRKDGGLYPAQLTISAIRDRNGVVRNYVGVFSDITVAKRSQDELERLAHHDFLTGLPNRLLFNARLIHALERARREGRQVTVLFLDLDGFKAVNDTCGHLAGDELLRQVATRLSHSLRADDTMARLGGDEFAAILEGVGTDAERALVASKLLQVLSEPFVVAGESVWVGTSIGIARYPQDGADATVLLQHADAAMYAAKADGRHGFSFYRPPAA